VRVDSTECGWRWRAYNWLCCKRHVFDGRSKYEATHPVGIRSAWRRPARDRIPALASCYRWHIVEVSNIYVMTKDHASILISIYSQLCRLLILSRMRQKYGVQAMIRGCS
jgi:hypothetical protein